MAAGQADLAKHHQVVRDRPVTQAGDDRDCEGEIDRIGRVWADGQLLELEGLTTRFYRGTETQDADSLIEAAAGFVVVWLFTGTRVGSTRAERRAQQQGAGVWGSVPSSRLRQIRAV